MLNSKRERYQQGSIRKVKRAKGFAWEYRYYVTHDKKRVLKTQSFSSASFPTEKALRQYLAGFTEKLNRRSAEAPLLDVTFNVVIDRYINEEMPGRHSTQGSYQSIIRRHIRPQWGSKLVSEIRPADLHAWFQGMDLAPVTRGHLRSKMHHLFDLAILWEYLPVGRNPVEIVKIKNVTRRTKETVVLTYDQFRQVIGSLPVHVNLLAITIACLGLRVSEALGLKWEDIDWKDQTIEIVRSAYRGAIDETKTTASKSRLPLHPFLAELLKVWQGKAEFEWVFANPATGMPYQSPSLQQRRIRPACECIGIQGLGFHSLRHSYRSWLDSFGTAPSIRALDHSHS